MEKNKKINTVKSAILDENFIHDYWEKSWTYIKSVSDVVREPVLILDKNFCVMAANESFYRTFQVEAINTENKLIYELGNGQWNIPALKKLLENILPKNTFFKGFEVTHEFPVIGHKIMILNARQIHVEDEVGFPSIILLAMEDVTEIMSVAEMLAGRTNRFEAMAEERIKGLEEVTRKLNKEISGLKTKKK